MAVTSIKRDNRWRPRINGDLAGPYYQKEASGSDAITALKPRSSYLKQWPPHGYSLAKRMDKFAKRNLPPQSYTMRVIDVFYSPRFFSTWAVADQWKANYLLNPTDWAAPARPFPVWAEYKILSQLRSKLYGSGFSPAVFMAEGHQAVSMIGDSAFRIRLALSSLMHKDWRGLVAALNVSPKNAKKIIGKPGLTLSQRWLELQYGWKPLLSDAEDGARWIAATIYGGTQEKYPVLRASIDPIVYTDFRSPSQSGTEYIWGCREIRYDLSYRVYAWKKAPSYVPSLATVAGVAWEMAPYSFVVDWFFPIGQYLDALRTASDISGTFVRSLKTTTTFSDPRHSPRLLDYGLCYPFLPPKRVEVQFSRTVTNEARVPTPEFVGWSQVLNLKRAANTVALLVAGKWFSKAQLAGMKMRGYTE